MSVYTPPIIQQIFMNVMASKTYSIANICFHLEVSPISMMRSCVMLAAVNFEPFTLYNTHRESAYPNALRSLKAGGNVRLTPIQHVNQEIIRIGPPLFPLSCTISVAVFTDQA